jgi:hypothetical protein
MVKYISGKLIINSLILLFYLFSSSIAAQEMKRFNLGNAIIPVKFIKDGGPPRDGIPSIDDPEEETAELLNEGDSIEAISLFWFAWIAFHPDTEIYRFKR